MKNLLFMGVLCLFFTISVFSQTTDPVPMSFNWGSYTAPFHDSSHSFTRPVLGWQWGANDSSFDNYIGANMTHGDGSHFHYAGTKNGMGTIFENKGALSGAGYRYDAEIIPLLTNDFRPYRYDSSGAVFGWLWRNTSISQLDTATPNKPLGRIKVNGSGLVFKNMSPNRGFGRFDVNATPAIGQKWYVAINIRRTDSTNTDTTNNPALSLRIKYWARNLSDGTKFPRNDFSIVFDSIPDTATWHSRGYWNGKCKPQQDSIIVITRKMLPLHGISGRTPDVTYFAYFRLTDWNKDTLQLNPVLNNGTWLFTTGNDKADLAEGNYHIDSLSVEVTSFGFPVSIDYIRLEDTSNKELLRGERDTKFYNKMQNFITGLDTIAPQVKVRGFSPAIELRWSTLLSYRYFNKLTNGYAFSDPAETIHHHISHIVQPKYYWRFSGLDKVDGRIAAPFYRKPDGVNCLGRESLSWSHGYLMLHKSSGSQWPNFGDTTKSMYETSVPKWGYNYLGHHGLQGYMSRAELQSIDTMSMPALSFYVNYRPYTFQIALDYKYAAEYLYGENDKSLYNEVPWWSQKLIHNIWHILDTSLSCPPPKNRAVREDWKRENTGEEIRYLFWADIIKGAKGFMIDNGGLYRLTTFLTPADTLIQTHQGYITLRKVQNYNTLYNSDNPNDGDFLMQNDSTYLSRYINRARTAAIFSVDSNRIYMGIKSTRLSVKNAFDFMNNNADEVMRLRLVSWMSKGYKSVYTGDTAAMGRLIRYKVNTGQTGFRLRPLDRTHLGNPFYEPKDSTFYDLSVLRDKNDTQKEFDSVFYIGIVNRRTDPLRMLRTPISDTTKPKLLKFLSMAEYIDSCKVSPDSLLWKNEYWTQHGTREITIPFRSQFYNGAHSLLRIQEMGGTLDTVIGSERSLSLRFLPGQGKIFRIRPIKGDTNINGILAHSNQRKLISFPIPVYDSTLSKYVLSPDSVRYYLCYFRPFSDSNKRTNVYYRRSKTAAFNTPSANVEWESEVTVSDHYVHPTRVIKNDTCAYPSVVTRYDTITGRVYAYIVYGCKGYMPIPPPGGQEPFQRIVRTRLWHTGPYVYMSSYVIVDSVYSNNLSDFGTPMVAATEQDNLGGNFYTWSDKKRGIGIGWQPSSYPILQSKKYIRFHEDTSECPTVWKAQHPSLSTYNPVRQKGTDCALAWQENYSCSDNRAEIFTTRLRVNGGTIQHYLGADFENAGNYGYFNADSSIYCLSNNEPPLKDTVRLGNYFPMPWRELSLRDTCSIVPLSAASRIRMDAFVWQQTRPFMFSPPTYTRLLLGGLLHPDTLIGGIITPIRTSILTKTILSHFPNGDLYFPSISQGTANATSDSYSLQAAGCLNSSITSLVINAIETNQAVSGYIPRYIHQELSHTPFAFVAPQKSIAGTKFDSYIHLAGMTFAHAPSTRWEQRRVYNHRPTYYAPAAVPQILASAHYFYKQSDDIITRSYLGWNDADGSISVTLPEINTIPLQWNVRSNRESPYMIPSDTLFTEWFRINDLTHMKQWIKTEGWDALQVYVQKKGEEPQRLPYGIRKSADGRGMKHQTDFINGDNEEYRLLFSRGTETAYLERTIITEPDNDGLEKATIQTIDLRQLPKSNVELSIYPNPASDELTITWKGGKATVQLLDMKGNILNTQTIHGLLTFSTEELPNGLYIIRLQQGMNSVTKSFMVLK